MNEITGDCDRCQKPCMLMPPDCLDPGGKMFNRKEEWHVTVATNPFSWRGVCSALNIKPLWIELNNFERQLMCAANYDPTEALRRCDIQIIRVKHEVQCAANERVMISRVNTSPDWERHDAVYYECHVKVDGTFMPFLPMASRDLYRDNRWYLTQRSQKPFDPKNFVSHCRALTGGTANIAGWEYEAAMVDTNPGLDARWR